MVVAYVPQRDDDIPFDAFRARRGRRYVAFRDAFGPAGVRLEQGLALVVEHAIHRRAADARAEPPFPRFFMRLEFWLCLEDVIDRTRLFVAELMAEVAVGLEGIDVVVLRLHRRADAVARGAGAWERAGGRRFEQGQPVVTRIHLRGFLRRLGERRIQRDVGRAGGFQLDRRRIDEAVSANEDPIGRGRQLGHHEASLVVGDDDLDEVRGEVFRLGDDPHASLGAVAAANDTPDEALRGRALREQRTPGIEGAGGDEGDQYRLLHVHGARL